MENKLIMKGLSGSRAYGTSTPESDTDIRGIFCAPKRSIVTPYFPVKEMVIPEEEDGKLYELTNFMKLFTDQNPNILELLFIHKDDILFSTPEYDILREAAPKLLSRKTAFTFSGYAMSQLKRIMGHDKWISNPQPEKAPVQKDFFKSVVSFCEVSVGMLDIWQSECCLMPYGNNMYGVVPHPESPGLFNEDGSIRKMDYALLPDHVKGVQPYVIIRYLEEEHKTATTRHSQYWEWKKNRNEKRHELEVAYGYDTKHAMHLVRLMRMAEEILKDGTVNVRRPDAKELLDIRNGAWSYESLLEWAEEKDKYIREELYVKSPLRRSADLDLAAQVLMEVQELCWK